MYTIIMNSDKSLVTTVRTTLFQREKLADKIQFLFPEYYGDLTLNEFTAVLKYLDPGNELHSEILVPDEALYKDKIRYTLPVDTKLTRFAGDITIRITLTKTDMNTRNKYVLHTGETTITVSPLQDWYKFASDNSLEVLDRKMLELDARLEAAEKIAEIYDAEKADNIVKVVDGTDIKLQLESNGVPVGDAVTIGDTGEDGVTVTVFNSSPPENTDEGSMEDVVEF